MKSSKLPEINTFSLEEQVAQMVVVRSSGYLFDHEIKYPQWEAPAAKLQHLIADIGVGGVILLGGSAAELPGCRGAGKGRGTRESPMETLSPTHQSPVTDHQSPVPSPLYQLADPTAHATVSRILPDSTEVIGSLPLGIENLINLRNLIVLDDVLDCKFLTRHSPAIAIPQQIGYTTQICDNRIPVISDSEAPQPTLLQLFIPGNPFLANAGLTQVAQDWFKKLLTTGELQALVIYGSPYVKNQFLSVLPSNIPCVFSDG